MSEYELRKEPVSLGVDFFKRFDRDELLNIKGLIDSILSERDSTYPLSVSESYRRGHISIRVRNALRFMDINYWFELSTFSMNKIERMQNVGRKTINEILEQVNIRGIELNS